MLPCSLLYTVPPFVWTSCCYSDLVTHTHTHTFVQAVHLSGFFFVCCRGPDNSHRRSHRVRLKPSHYLKPLDNTEALSVSDMCKEAHGVSANHSEETSVYEDLHSVHPVRLYTSAHNLSLTLEQLRYLLQRTFSCSHKHK